MSLQSSSSTTSGFSLPVPSTFLTLVDPWNRHATYCPRAFELANHFAEWAGFQCDYNLLPTTSTRLAFIRDYLQTHHDIVRERDGADGSLPSRVTQAEVDRVMAEVDTFRGFPGFYW